MTDYEKGSPAWDIGMILTRHRSIVHGDNSTCVRVVDLQISVGLPAHIRLEKALATPCDCGAGDSETERSSLNKNRRLDESSTRKATA